MLPINASRHEDIKTSRHDGSRSPVTFFFFFFVNLLLLWEVIYSSCPCDMKLLNQTLSIFFPTHVVSCLVRIWSLILFSKEMLIGWHWWISFFFWASSYHYTLKQQLAEVPSCATSKTHEVLCMRKVVTAIFNIHDLLDNCDCIVLLMIDREE